MKVEELTVLVPTKNEHANIGPFLASLPPGIRLIVVDASTDDTPEIIRTLRPESTRVIRSPGGISVARQIGAEAAETEWLLFTDADVSLAPDYMERLTQCPQVDVIYGTKLSRDEHVDYYRRFARGQGVLHSLGIPAASGSNLLMRRQALDAAGGFDPELTVNEDTEVVYRAKRAGCSVAFCSELVVYARDHRRLQGGSWRKSAHTLLRCTLLWLGLMPKRWKRADWGYWKSGRGPKHLV